MPSTDGAWITVSGTRVPKEFPAPCLLTNESGLPSMPSSLSLRRMIPDHAILPDSPVADSPPSEPEGSAADFVSMGNGSHLPPHRQCSGCACWPIFKIFFCLEVFLRSSPPSFLRSRCSVCPHTVPIPFLTIGRPP